MNERDIHRLIKIIEETGIDEIEVRKWWGGRIRVAKRGPAYAANTVPGFASGAQTPASVPVSEGSGGSEVSTAPEPVEEAPRYSEDTHYIINSPIVGTFYRAPAPEAPPYVEIGDSIKAGQVVCIVEAMKLMNEIQAERGGRIVEILVENAQPVEYNQMMIVLEPE